MISLADIFKFYMYVTLLEKLLELDAICSPANNSLTIPTMVNIPGAFCMCEQRFIF